MKVNNSIKRILWHSIFWTGWLVSMSVFNGISPQDNIIYPFFMALLIGLPLYMLYTYVTVYWFIPKVLLPRNRFFIAILYFLGASFLLGFVQSLQMKYVVHRFFYTAMERSSDYKTIYVVLKDMIWVNIPMIMFAGLKYVKDFILETRRKNELYNQNLRAELSILKVQLKPHFLFNTLNNLYSMALEGSEMTADGIKRVTSLMKYIIYECSEDKVLIGKEIQLISDYLELEKLRYDSRLSLETSFKITDHSLKIAPLILFTFVENCFKHGSSRDAGKPFIRLTLSDKSGVLYFTAENSIPDEIKKTSPYEGLGLKNVKRRLEFIYHGKYLLDIRKSETQYSVLLEIDTRI